MKDTYRTYDDLRALLGSLEEGYLHASEAGEMEYFAKWMVDNGYQLERYEIAGEDDPDTVGDLTPDVIEQAKNVGSKYESLDLTNLIPPAKDRCPEDILKGEIETTGKVETEGE